MEAIRNRQVRPGRPSPTLLISATCPAIAWTCAKTISHCRVAFRSPSTASNNRTPSARSIRASRRPTVVSSIRSRALAPHEPFIPDRGDDAEVELQIHDVGISRSRPDLQYRSRWLRYSCVKAGPPAAQYRAHTLSLDGKFARPMTAAKTLLQLAGADLSLPRLGRCLFSS